VPIAVETTDSCCRRRHCALQDVDLIEAALQREKDDAKAAAARHKLTVERLRCQIKQLQVQQLQRPLRCTHVSSIQPHHMACQQLGSLHDLLFTDFTNFVLQCVHGRCFLLSWVARGI